MDPLAALPQPVMEALARGWTVLTGNQRAARTLRRNFDLHQRTLGLIHWQPAEILAWDSWLAALWHRLLLNGHDTQMLLNATQEHSLWRGIIAGDPNASPLRPLDSLAELASSAWARLHHYRAGRLLHTAANTTDTKAFARWAREFERHCLRSGFLTAAQLPETLATAVAAGQASVPQGLLLIGFDYVEPASTALLDAIQAAGAMVSQVRSDGDSGDASPVKTGSRLLVDAPDPNRELLACAGWLRERLRDDPQAQLAVIVPDIEADRAALDRALRNVLAPELNAIGAPTGSGPFEFSLGIPLDRTHVASVALDLLRWAVGPLAIDRVSTLLLSPHFAADSQTLRHEELLTRAELDAFTLRNCRSLEPRITPDELSSLISRSKDPSRLTGLRAQLRSLTAAIRRVDLKRERGHADWADAFQQILEAAAWAPPATLDSIEFQARQKWEDALGELASLDFDTRTGRVPFHSALGALERIAAQMLFAPESRHASIQIMGPLEAAGSSFDALWFLRATDLNWPPASTVHTLLPYSLQRQFAMPGADAAEDSVREHRMTQRIVHAASVVIFSYAQHTAVGNQRFAPVLSHFSLETEASEAVAPLQADPVPMPLDRLLDNAMIQAPPSHALRGGAAILQAQAACAFRAFAERRLFSIAPDRVSLGLDARDRGSIVHNVLHYFWSQVRTQASLRAMTNPERDALLSQCIDTALAQHRPTAGAAWGDAYLDAERHRLQRLLGTWLDFEAKDRSPFTVKSSEEKLAAIAIGPLHLDIRVDRVDETVPKDANELPAEIILDYKTGRADPAGWEGERPDSPQLPLYAVVSPAAHLAAVAFAVIRPGKDMTLAGYQSQSGILSAPKKGQTRNLEAQRQEWQDVLTELAEEFHAGHALASPKRYPETCLYCQQRLLCRLEVSAFAAADEAIAPEDATGVAAAAQEEER